MGALDEFRAQREAAEDIRTALVELARLLAELRAETDALARDERLVELLREERAWLAKAEDVVREARHFREREINRLWPAVWRRWALAVAFSFATAFVAGLGYGWADRWHQEELAMLRERHQLVDAILDRALAMTPTERQQFDALMRARDVRKR